MTYKAEPMYKGARSWVIKGPGGERLAVTRHEDEKTAKLIIDALNKAAAAQSSESRTKG